MGKYVIGIDFGSLSARAVLVETQTGVLLAQQTEAYPHAVMDRYLPCGKPLGENWALQHPADYLHALHTVVPGVVDSSGVDAGDIVGVALDFTSCTILPVDAGGVPLCFDRKWEEEPHAYVKMWKHHAAQTQADRITALARDRGEPFLARVGGKISSESFLPKVLQILEEAPGVYEATASFLEAADFVTAQLIGGQVVRSSCCAGYKNMWTPESGYPSREFLAALDPRLTGLYTEKVTGPVCRPGTPAGWLSEEAAVWSHLQPGTAVAVAAIDAHVSAPAVGISGPGQLLMIMGTSGCDIICDEEEHVVQGICGVVKDGVLPGYYGYEAGQACLGDHFDWFARNCVPASYQQQAQERGLPVQAILTEKAGRLQPGESGLLALDWWNGNRSVLDNGNLTGLILGMGLTTRPEELYRALIEATAFGKRMILENYERGGVAVREVYACGGICRKNPMLMQIFADVLNREIHVAGVEQAGALGAAMYAACAAGRAQGGWDTIAEAVRAMAPACEVTYRPVEEHAAVYDGLYREFCILHDYFGRGGNPVMQHLRAQKKHP